MLNQYNFEPENMESVEKIVESGEDIEMRGMQQHNSTELASDRHGLPSEPSRSYPASRQISGDTNLGSAHLTSGSQVQPLSSALPVSVPASSAVPASSNEPSSQDSSPSVPGQTR